MAETIPIGSDHAGFALKSELIKELKSLGYTPEDLGTYDGDPTGYAPVSHRVADKVSSGEVRQGILLCGTGLGMSYAANRHQGVRAAVAWSPEIAGLAREHNDANILVFPARFVSLEEAKSILHTWLNTAFAGGRHTERVAQIEVGKP